MAPPTKETSVFRTSRWLIPACVVGLLVAAPALADNLYLQLNRDIPTLGVIHNASSEAARQKVAAWFTNSKDREKLFSGSYPLAWGKESVKPDAFLTGVVSHGKDLKTTTVRLELFDSKAPDKL